MLHNTFLEGECYKIQGGKLCLARPWWLGITVLDKLYLSCSLIGIKIAVQILKWKSI